MILLIKIEVMPLIELIYYIYLLIIEFLLINFFFIS